MCVCVCPSRTLMTSSSTKRHFCWNITTESKTLQPNLTEWFAHTKVKKTKKHFKCTAFWEMLDWLVFLFVFEDAADDINRIASSLYTLGTQDSTDLCKYAHTHINTHMQTSAHLLHCVCNFTSCPCVQGSSWRYQSCLRKPGWVTGFTTSWLVVVAAVLSVCVRVCAENRSSRCCRRGPEAGRSTQVLPARITGCKGEQEPALHV